jgi:hypothetical protein
MVSNYHNLSIGINNQILNRLAVKCLSFLARTYLQLPLMQWGADNVYLLLLSSWKVNIVKNPIAVMWL